MTTPNAPTSTDQTQYICVTKPDCLCVPENSRGPEMNPWDECDCFSGNRLPLLKICAACGAQLELINFETGETIEA